MIGVSLRSAETKKNWKRKLLTFAFQSYQVIIIKVSAALNDEFADSATSATSAN